MSRFTELENVMGVGPALAGRAWKRKRG